MKRRTRGILLIAVGLLLTFLGAGIYAGYEKKADMAGSNARILLEEVKKDIKQRQVTAVVTEAPEGQMLQSSVNGHAVVGILQAEEAGIQLPVLENWSYEKLEYGPCRYSGTLDGGDLVLLGHNYGQHLADLDQLEQGDAVEFVDVEGKVHQFRVAKTSVISPTQIEALSAGDYPLTIFTCTPGGQSRFVLYCRSAETEDWT